MAPGGVRNRPCRYSTCLSLSRSTITEHYSTDPFAPIQDPAPSSNGASLSSQGACPICLHSRRAWPALRAAALWSPRRRSQAARADELVGQVQAAGGLCHQAEADSRIGQRDQPRRLHQPVALTAAHVERPQRLVPRLRPPAVLPVQPADPDVRRAGAVAADRGDQGGRPPKAGLRLVVPALVEEHGAQLPQIGALGVGQFMAPAQRECLPAVLLCQVEPAQVVVLVAERRRPRRAPPGLSTRPPGWRCRPGRRWSPRHPWERRRSPRP